MTNERRAIGDCPSLEKLVLAARARPLASTRAAISEQKSHNQSWQPRQVIVCVCFHSVCCVVLCCVRTRSFVAPKAQSNNRRLVESLLLLLSRATITRRARTHTHAQLLSLQITFAGRSRMHPSRAAKRIGGRAAKRLALQKLSRATGRSRAHKTSCLLARRPPHGCVSFIVPHCNLGATGTQRPAANRSSSLRAAHTRRANLVSARAQWANDARSVRTFTFTALIGSK